MSKIKVFQPKYYKNFICTGSGCKNNCCHHWIIYVDKHTYNKYKSLEEETQKEFDEKLGFTDESKNEVYIKLNSEKKCVFLDEDGLCTIQLRFGHEYLSDTCRSYPRIINRVGNSLERYLEISCEAAAELILFNEELMIFDEVELDSHNDSDSTRYMSILKPEVYSKDIDALNIFQKLRAASIAILQCRHYKVRFRMLILCLFIQEITGLLAANQNEQIFICANDYINRLDVNYYNELSSAMPNGVECETDIVIDILKEMYQKETNFNIFIDQVIKGFGIDRIRWNIPEGFNENYSKADETYLSDNEYVLKNYLIHRVLSEGFPFNYKNETDVMSNYVDLLAKYNIVEFMVTGISKYHKRFDKKNIIDCISVFTRGYEHSSRRYL